MVNSVVMEAGEPLRNRHSGAARVAEPGISATTSRPRLRRRPGTTPKPASLLRLADILDGLEGLEFDVVKFAVDLLDLADIDVLHDVAGFRIDRDRAARAFPLHPLHGADQGIAIGLAARLLQRLIDEVNAVIAAHRHKTRT